jgi:hypothetical protein
MARLPLDILINRYTLCSDASGSRCVGKYVSHRHADAVLPHSSHETAPDFEVR